MSASLMMARQLCMAIHLRCNGGQCHSCAAVGGGIVRVPHGPLGTWCKPACPPYGFVIKGDPLFQQASLVMVHAMWTRWPKRWSPNCQNTEAYQ